MRACTLFNVFLPKQTFREMGFKSNPGQRQHLLLTLTGKGKVLFACCNNCGICGRVKEILNNHFQGKNMSPSNTFFTKSVSRERNESVSTNQQYLENCGSSGILDICEITLLLRLSSHLSKQCQSLGAGH